MAATTPEYVYALHDFEPQNEDEIRFLAGERIEVVERDDAYGDGWWTGRNLVGKLGIFPKDYTTPAAPLVNDARTPTNTSFSGTSLHPLTEEAETPELIENHVMAATMTDVQAAIDQLGNSRNDDGRSMSFMSTLENERRDSVFSHRLDDDDDEFDGESWRDGARRRLFEGVNALDGRHTTPPIDVEISDESDGDDDHPRGHLHASPDSHKDMQQHIPRTASPEADTDTPSNPSRTAQLSPSPVPFSEHSSPGRQSSTITSEAEPQPAARSTPQVNETPTALLTPVESTTPAATTPPPPPPPVTVTAPAPSVSPATPPPVLAPAPGPVSVSTPTPTPAPAPAPAPVVSYTPPAVHAVVPTLVSAPDTSAQTTQPATPIAPSVTTLPRVTSTPTEATVGSQLTASTFSAFLQTQTQPEQIPLPTSPNTITLTPSAPYSSAPASNMATLVSSGASSTAASTSSLAPPREGRDTKPHPSEWSVEQVVEWVRGRGFDESICSKFQEHEITGDVLLEFDVTMLKEIDIIAFGKRVRIFKDIQELRRPPSVVSFDAVSIPHRGSTSSSVPPLSAPWSIHQTPGVSVPWGREAYSPTLGPITAQSPVPVRAPGVIEILQEDFDGPLSVPPHQRADSEPNAPPSLSDISAVVLNGNLTVGSATTRNKNRPLSLALSNSDGALLNKSVVAESDAEGKADKLSFDDRNVVSEPEGRRGFIFKRDKHKHKSAELEPHAEIGRAESPGTVGRSRVSLDLFSPARPRSIISAQGSGEHKERHSFFGSTLGKNRKPAPRYPADQQSVTPSNKSGGSDSNIHSPNISEEKRMQVIGKLYGGDLEKAPLPPGAKTKEQRAKEKEEKERAKEEKERAKEEKERAKEEKERAKKERDSQGPPPTKEASVLRKRTISVTGSASQPNSPFSPHDGPSTSGHAMIQLKSGVPVLDQFKEILGESDFSGWMQKKGERYNTWKNRFFFLKGPHLYYLRSKSETKVKGYINITGYKVVVDDAGHPGRYGFRIVHETNKPHYFCSEEQHIVRDWMKALMKATIDRDYTRPVISSSNIPTIPLVVAQAMNPAPRPPSPTQRDAIQKTMRSGLPIELSQRDARVLMGVAGGATIAPVPAPARPSREMRRPTLASGDEPRISTSSRTSAGVVGGDKTIQLLDWINSNLPPSVPKATDLGYSLSSGLILYRLAESIRYGRDSRKNPSNNPQGHPNLIVPDHLFDEKDDNVEGLMKLFDFLIENEVKLHGLSMADIREGRADRLAKLLHSMRSWQERRKALATSIGSLGVVSGSFMGSS